MASLVTSLALALCSTGRQTRWFQSFNTWRHDTVWPTWRAPRRRRLRQVRRRRRRVNGGPRRRRHHIERRRHRRPTRRRAARRAAQRLVRRHARRQCRQRAGARRGLVGHDVECACNVAGELEHVRLVDLDAAPRGAAASHEVGTLPIAPIAMCHVSMTSWEHIEHVAGEIHHQHQCRHARRRWRPSQNAPKRMANLMTPCVSYVSVMMINTSDVVNHARHTAVVECVRWRAAKCWSKSTRCMHRIKLTSMATRQLVTCRHCNEKKKKKRSKKKKNVFCRRGSVRARHGDASVFATRPTSARVRPTHRRPAAAAPTTRAACRVTTSGTRLGSWRPACATLKLAKYSPHSHLGEQLPTLNFECVVVVVGFGCCCCCCCCCCCLLLFVVVCCCCCRVDVCCR